MLTYTSFSIIFPQHAQGALTDMAASLLGDLASTPAGAVEEALEPAYFIGSDKRMRFDSMKEAHIAFCFQAPPAGSEHTYPLALMGAIMGERAGQ